MLKLSMQVKGLKAKLHAHISKAIVLTRSVYIQITPGVNPPKMKAPLTLDLAQ